MDEGLCYVTSVMVVSLLLAGNPPWDPVSGTLQVIVGLELSLEAALAFLKWDTGESSFAYCATLSQ